MVPKLLAATTTLDPYRKVKMRLVYKKCIPMPLECIFREPSPQRKGEKRKRLKQEQDKEALYHTCH